MIIDQEALGTQTYVRAEVFQENASEAVQSLYKQLKSHDLACVIFFCSSHYNLQELEQALNDTFSCKVLGCTTSGEIGSQYNENSLVAIGFLATHFNVDARLIENLDQFDSVESSKMRAHVEHTLNETSTFENGNRLGFLLIDGLSGKEEVTVASLYNSFDGMEVVGGSAGDYLEFENTYVFCEGRFASNAAAFAVIETDLPFKVFKFQHFKPTDLDMVITSADISARLVHEIDGGTAATEYANLLGLNLDQLNPQVFANHPVMLQIGDEWYVRSIREKKADGSLAFYCAIDEGIPLTIAKGIDYVKVLEDQVNDLRSELGGVSFALGCDCVLRRLEMKSLDVFGEVEEQLKKINFSGFSSYGEQINSIHVNQTLTGVAFGLPEVN